jgi:hypothetical protein
VVHSKHTALQTWVSSWMILRAFPGRWCGEQPLLRSNTFQPLPLFQWSLISLLLAVGFVLGSQPLQIQPQRSHATMGHSSRYALSEPLTGKLCAYFVLPTVLIIAFTQLLSLILGRIRQPRVIAEVIGGVFLGPTVLGRIPGLLFSR